MKETVLILGAGVPHGVGGAIARRFGAEGYHVIVSGRTLEKVSQVADEVTAAGGSAQSMVVDVTSPDDQDALFAAMPEGSRLAAVLYNAGNNAIIPFEKLSAEQFEMFWRIGCFGAFLAAERAVPILKSQGGGSLFFTGASGSLRGKANFAHFASMKAGLRNLTQSLAREFGPEGIHVAHFIIDGIIGGDKAEKGFPEYVDALGEDGTLSPDGIADAFMYVHQQPRSTWTQELDLRPFKEKW